MLDEQAVIPNRINKKSRINMLMPHKQPFSLSLLLIS
ncbi:hypothetical protein AVU45_gp40 [Staphylococcus phage 23MRA]|uniref:Uncharacterized protein n=2 Tax=root TaxID=1 RepID=A0A0H3U322_9CAUD|nr:hypothetical protein AVU45_gp40 [Staphylococcus phage 23MRA]AIB56291.1 hypothetical protein [Staphylococcus phage 23MRA]BAQ35609.1 hypothetical protein [Staphylococcus aureus]